MPIANINTERDVRAFKAYLPGRRTGPSLLCTVIYICVRNTSTLFVRFLFFSCVCQAYANFSQCSEHTLTVYTHSFASVALAHTHTHKYKQLCTTQSFNRRKRLLLLKKWLLLLRFFFPLSLAMFSAMCYYYSRSGRRFAVQAMKCSILQTILITINASPVDTNNLIE